MPYEYTPVQFEIHQASSRPATTTMVSSAVTTRIVGGMTYPHDAVGSLFVSARTLALLRVTGLLFFFVVLAIDLGMHFVDSEGLSKDAGYFFYFTNLNHIGLVIYLLYTLHLTNKSFHWKSSSAISPFLATLHSLLYSWNAVFHFIVTAVYWALLSDRFFKQTNQLARFFSVAQHGITLLYVWVVELVLGYMAINVWALLPVVVVFALYAAWGILYYFWDGTWVYGFLDYTKSSAKYMYPGIAAACILSFFLIRGLHLWRNRILRHRTLNLPPALVAAAAYNKQMIPMTPGIRATGGSSSSDSQLLGRV